jgi:hypothetical protein
VLQTGQYSIGSLSRAACLLPPSAFCLLLSAFCRLHPAACILPPVFLFFHNAATIIQQIRYAPAFQL